MNPPEQSCSACFLKRTELPDLAERHVIRMETHRSGFMKIASLLPSGMEITTIENVAVVAVTIALKARATTISP